MREQFERECSVFQKVSAAPPEARAVLLDAVCGDDRALRQEVESLLAADATPPSWFRDAQVRIAAAQRAAEALADDDVAPRMDPERIGEYRLLGVLGAGGMGVVYRAVQPNLDREVALKVIRGDILSDRARNAFMREAAILAKLQHPNILHIYEAGVAELDGGPGGSTVKQPYFVMELLQNAISVTTFAEANELGIHERIDLFLKVCRAVAHAHERGIIHRDLKPGNILVTPEGEPKVLDFGIARALAHLDDGGGGETAARAGPQATQIIGTPPYVCPEQLAGDVAPDQLFDVFSLGVVLRDLVDDVEELAAPRMNAALAQIIQWATVKERSRRCESVNRLAAALAEWRQGRQRQPALRRRVAWAAVVIAAVAGASLLMLTLIKDSMPEGINPTARVTTPVSADLAPRFDRESRRPNAARMHELALAGDLDEFIVLLREKLQREEGSGSVEEERLRSDLAAALAELKIFDEAETHFRWCFERQSLQGPPESMAVIVPRTRLAWCIAEQGRFAEAQREFEAILAAVPAELDSHSIVAQARVGLGWCLVRGGSMDEARALFEQGLATLRRQYHPNHAILVRCEEVAGELQ